MNARIFHHYDTWPSANSTVTVPRMTEDEVQEVIQSYDLAEEREVVGGIAGYSIREYRNPKTNDFIYLGGVFG